MSEQKKSAGAEESKPSVYELATCWPVGGGPPPKGALAWVVGAGAVAGTGGAVARRLARGGMRVVLTGRTPAKLEELARVIRSEGGEAIVAPGDAGTEEGLSEPLEAVKREGPLHVTVYNAGGSQWRSSPLEMETAFFEDVWRINCLGAFITARESTRLMLERGGGVILFTGSISGVKAQPKLVAYASAKFGQRALAEGFARGYGPKNIHVANMLIHGPIDGDRFNNAWPGAKDKRPVDNMIPVENIAEAYWQVIIQSRNSWTQEMVMRPYCEPF
jgi:NAD(P)-dependent dehydrogenase (short-subunit alcohol dehydrogenase family)